MKIIKTEQGSDEWHKHRLGIITGSKIKDAIGNAHLKLIDTLIAELLSNAKKEVRLSEEMQRGLDEEPKARKLYEKITGNKVEELGFCIHDKYDWLGFSPDGLIKKNGKYVGGIEIKSPSSSKHIEYIRIKRVPNEYRMQVFAYFLIVETLEWVDFVSFDDRILSKPIHIHRITRDEIAEELAKVEQGLIEFYKKFNHYYELISF